MSTAHLPADEGLAHFSAPSDASVPSIFPVLLANVLWNVMPSESLYGWCTFVTFIVT